jgi:hypothetical protein
MAVDLAVQGDAPMKVFMKNDDSTGSSSSLSQLLLEILSDDTDPLLQMSALDCLETMSTTVPMHGHRARWLVSSPVIGPLLHMTGASSDNDEEEDEPNLLLSGPALRLLSSICQLGQRDSTLFPHVSNSSSGSPQQQQVLQTGFYRALLRACESCGGEVDRLAFVDAVSSYASASPEALVLVLQDLVLKQKWLSLQAAQPKLKSIILLSVARVMDPPPPAGLENDTIHRGHDDTTRNVPSDAMANRLLGALSEMNRDKDAIELILGMAMASPWVEERLGSYALLTAIARRGRQGVQTLFLHAGFLEFVTSRDSRGMEVTKEGKEAKFEIIQAILQNHVGKELLAEPIVQQLETMIRQGPHYVKTQHMDVMLGDAQ